MSDTPKNAFNEGRMAWFSAIAEAREDFPLSFEQIKEATALSFGSWHHPLVAISHALLEHYKIVDDPFMLSSFADEEKYKQVGCHCFYATVSYNDLAIFVYDNYGEGNMCADIPENLRAVLPYPEWLKARMPEFRAIVKDMIDREAKTEEYNPPRQGYLWTDEPAPAALSSSVRQPREEESPSLG